jgi:hypothetical protein
VRATMVALLAIPPARSMLCIAGKAPRHRRPVNAALDRHGRGRNVLDTVFGLTDDVEARWTTGRLSLAGGRMLQGTAYGFKNCHVIPSQVDRRG